MLRLSRLHKFLQCWNQPPLMYFSHRPVCVGLRTQYIVSSQILAPVPAPRVNLTTAELSCCKQVFGTNVDTVTLRCVGEIHPWVKVALYSIYIYFIQVMELQLHSVCFQYLMLSIQQSTPRGKNMLMSIQRGNQLSVLLKHSQLTTSGLSTFASSWFPKLPGTVEKHTVSPAKVLHLVFPGLYWKSCHAFYFMFLEESKSNNVGPVL